jgi:hypothetical protein
VLLGQGYRTPHGAVIDEWSNDGLIISKEKPRNLETKLPQCHIVHLIYDSFETCTNQSR